MAEPPTNGIPPGETPRKRIYVGKTDEATLVVEKLIDADAPEVVLSIPKFSRLVESPANFHLLRREAEVLGKKLLIESVDDKVIEFCKASRLESTNPFFSYARRQFADIVRKQAPRSGVASRAETRERHEHHPSPPEHKRPSHVSGEPARRRFPSFGFMRRMFRSRTRRIAGAVIALLLVGGGAATALPKAEIVLTMATRPWTYEDTVRAVTQAQAVDPAAKIIPGELFTERKNLTLSFPASGRRTFEERARGTITIANAFSSQPQRLVASTRFEAPDGKIFRLANAVTVPGVHVKDGRIVPSTIDAPVIADKPGEAYNIGPVSKFTIPGFSGTPKFNGFSGVSATAMAGGFVGEAAYPTDADTAAAKETSEKTLKQALQSVLLAQLPSNFKMLDAAMRFSLTRQTVDAKPRPDGQFTVFAEGELSLLIFQESDLTALIGEKLREAQGADVAVRASSITYDEARIRRTGNELILPVRYEATLARAVDAAGLERQIAGTTERELKTLIFALPGLEKAKVSLWPFWVRRVPRNAERIEIAVR